MPAIRLDKSIFQGELDRLDREFRRKPQQINKILSSVSNRTARGIKTEISKGIRERVAVKKTDIDPHIRDTRATPRRPTVKITLAESKRLGLSRFGGARQTKTGVSYRISRNEGRKSVAGAFIVPSKGGHVFRRLTNRRLPIRLLRGLSPWGAYVKNPELDEIIRREGAERFRRELSQRIDFELLKRQQGVGR